jgi:hypothetical protein
MDIKLVVATAVALVMPNHVAAQHGRSETVFACALHGGKTVRVTRQGDRFTYRFGTARVPELTIVGSPAARNMFAASALHGGATYYTQLRFIQGAYSFVVYAMEGGRLTDSEEFSGLVVYRNGQKIAERACARMTALSFYTISELPKDADGAPLAWGDD